MTGIGLAGDTMNQDLKQREQLSALVDGQLQGEEWAEVLRFAAQDEGRAAWQAYHLVGDVLRSAELARPGDSGAFLARLQQKIAEEPQPPRTALETLVQAEPMAVPEQAANASVYRWKMVAGLASLAAVTALGWSAVDTLRSHAVGPQLAAAPAAMAPAQVAATGSADQQVMLRDPRLDELLAAHKQFGGATALQMPAGFLRNANFDAPSR